MSGRARAAIVAVVVAAIAIEIFLPAEDAAVFESTTYGTRQTGFRVAYEMLRELGAPVERFHEAVRSLPAAATAWWIAPFGLCAGPGVASELMAAPRAWIEAGGTGVVFVPQTVKPVASCEIAGTTLALSNAHSAGDRLSELGPDRFVKSVRLNVFHDLDPHRSGFDEGWTIRARYSTEPFVIERPLGRGRLVVVADARVLQNETLSSDDGAALFAVDLVRAFGPPRIVEAEQRLLDARSRSAIVYLARSPAMALFAGLVLTGLLVAWRGGLVPARTIDVEPVPAPTLQTFVGSLARLYAGSHDYPRLLARYRDLTARRLRASLGLPANAPLEALVERIERTHPNVSGARATLMEARAGGSAEAFHAVIARLDALAAKVIR